MIRAYASEVHFAAHLQPIADVLGTDVEKVPTPIDGLWVVANIQDARRAKRFGRVVLSEHGAGQRYKVNGEWDRNPSNPGGARRDFIAGFLCPNEICCRANRAAYPETPCEVVGSPRLDALAVRQSDADRVPSSRVPPRWTGASSEAPVVAFGFHWGTPQVSPSSALAAFDRPLRGLVRSGQYQIIGTGHPRARHTLQGVYDNLGIEAVWDLGEVCRRAELFACDNSSAIPEFAAATGKPVLFLNHPEWRDVHGGRFGGWNVGQVHATPDGLEGALELALVDPPDVREARRHMIETVFPLRDGKSAARSAAFLRRIDARAA